MQNISYSIASDLLKNKAIFIYGSLLAVLGWGMFLIESQPEKTILALLQITLIVVPLMTGIFATIYYYNSAEFVQLLLIQPLRRSSIIWGIFAGLTSGFVLSFLVGIGLPLLLFYPTTASIHLILSGIFLSVIFTGLALLVSTHQQDKARSIGFVLLLWIFFTFIFDGILLWTMYQLADYPIEKSILFVTFLNPVSVARTLVVMQTEAAALLGLSGAIFQDFFGSLKGSFIAILALIIWGVIPYLFIKRKFLTRDF
ncbi:MAG TPA: ABC transporter permease [Saprospiraceae bacterium]|nr:ABC transporter permease [Saprospiraceae bacterium]HPN69635.1 ABC transporter permease [Saprospiraceae bacterium]